MTIEGYLTLVSAVGEHQSGLLREAETDRPWLLGGPWRRDPYGNIAFRFCWDEAREAPELAYYYIDETWDCKWETLPDALMSLCYTTSGGIAIIELVELLATGDLFDGVNLLENLEILL